MHEVKFSPTIHIDKSLLQALIILVSSNSAKCHTVGWLNSNTNILATLLSMLRRRLSEIIVQDHVIFNSFLQTFFVVDCFFVFLPLCQLNAEKSAVLCSQTCTSIGSSASWLYLHGKVFGAEPASCVCTVPSTAKPILWLGLLEDMDQYCKPQQSIIVVRAAVSVSITLLAAEGRETPADPSSHTCLLQLLLTKQCLLDLEAVSPRDTSVSHPLKPV